jgi:3-polyprenyl-4-hydroxybenzoate decarboxylase
LFPGSPFTQNPELASQLVQVNRAQPADWPLVVVVDDADGIQDQTSFLWTVFTRFDPAWDIYAEQTVKHNRILYRGPIVIDARMKPEYPGELVSREDIVQRVSARWGELFGKRQW